MSKADSIKMGPELVKNMDCVEHLLSLSGPGRAPVTRFSSSEADPEVLIGGVDKKSGPGDRAEHILSAVKTTGTKVESVTR